MKPKLSPDRTCVSCRQLCDEYAQLLTTSNFTMMPPPCLYFSCKQYDGRNQSKHFKLSRCLRFSNIMDGSRAKAVRKFTGFVGRRSLLVCHPSSSRFRCCHYSCSCSSSRRSCYVRSPRSYQTSFINHVMREGTSEKIPSVTRSRMGQKRALCVCQEALKV